MRTTTMLLLCLLFTASFASDPIATADSLFSLRNENFNVEKLLADSTNVNAALQLYANVLQNGSNDSVRTEALWKILQVYYFKGQFCTLDKGLKKHIYDEALDLGEKYVTEFPENIAVYSWLGIIWARWAEVFGLLPAARKGVANKVKYYGEKIISMDDTYLGAGGYRLLGMLNFSVPKIPLFLTWPSKEKGMQYLEKAVKIAPENLYNQMYLAKVLYDMGDKPRAKNMAREIINQQDIIHDLAIDSFIKQEARTFLKEHD